MTRIACLVAAMALAADSGAAATERHAQSRSSPASHHHQHSAPVPAPATFRPAAVRPAVVAYAPYYPSYSSHQPLANFRATGPSLSYVPAKSPNAPPFSFNGSEEVQAWNWQRVSLQQIDAEVRAKRMAAAAAPPPPAYRRFCPDTRAYYPEVTRCESDWLTVVGAAGRR